MKTAIVGLGNIGVVHLEVLNKIGFPVIAVCDANAEKLKGLSCETYTDYDQMLESVKPDVVHICTPHYLHADMIVKALNKGVNVLCEKPLCIKEEDIDRILDAEKKAKAILGVCHQNRYNKENVFVKDYLKDKKVVGGHGEVVWRRTKEYYAQDAWRGKWQTEGGGVLINQALHTLDLLIWLIGKPKKVQASLSNVSLKEVIEVEDTASLICSDGGEFSFFATNAGSCDFPVRVSVKTEDELIDVLPQKVLIGNKEIDFEKDERIYGKCCYGVGHEALFYDFYHAIKMGKKFQIDGLEASKVIKVILNAYKTKVIK